MSHEAGKTEQGDSFAATNGRPNPPSSDDGGSIAAPGVNEARSQGSVEILESDEYGMESASQPGADPSPRNANYATDTAHVADSESKQRTKEQTTPLEPPVTKLTLGELDVNKIIHSPKLRHDINFDPALHFRPNLDGEKGRRKKQKASDFWVTMRKQIRRYLENRELFEKELNGEDWCLPVTLRTIREILETLVPQRDRASVEDTFNVDLLMQQFRKGVADLVKLAMWLSQLIKCHCAPMRDAWVDEMVVQISRGSKDGDVVSLVGGISTLLGILEAMKLDVANHQIRCLRPLLIEDTIHFEQKYFIKKISSGRIDLAEAHAWFKRACCLPDITPFAPRITTQITNTWHFMKRLVELAMPSESEVMVPHTFLFDEERLVKLRADVENSINLEICMHFFHEWESASRKQRALVMQYDDTPVTSTIPSPYYRPTSPSYNALHSSPTLPLPHHFASKTKSGSSLDSRALSQSTLRAREWQSNLENDSLALSSTSSCHSSPSSTASTPDTCSPIPLYLSHPIPDSTSQVRNSLIAILDPLMTPKRWTVLAPSLALQILRSTATPLARLPAFESELERHLSNPSSERYRNAKERVLVQLLPTLHKLVETYSPLTCVKIFELAAVQKNPLGIANTQRDPSRDEIKEIATKIAHIGILHWRVWAPLAYLIDPDETTISKMGP